MNDFLETEVLYPEKLPKYVDSPIDTYAETYMYVIFPCERMHICPYYV